MGRVAVGARERWTGGVWAPGDSVVDASVYVVDASVGAGEPARLYGEACVARSGVSGRRRQASAARSMQSILDAQGAGWICGRDHARIFTRKQLGFPKC